MSTSRCPYRTAVEQVLESAEVLSPELDQHVQDCPSCAERLAEITAGSDDLLEELRDALPTKAAALPQIEGYRVLEEIHRGGQGIVYAAQQLGTRRRVALKLLRGDVFATQTQQRRFEREIELVASFDHENIVTVFESGRTATGLPYLAMEYVDGTPLHRYLAEHDPGIPEVLALFCRICDGVNFAHQRGVLHRDLKPSNILVDRAGTPRVVDFGLAKELSGPEAQDAGPLTADGVFVGTLAYASPEQVSTDHLGVDLRTDVYALGVMLYEALTKRLPYDLRGGLREVVHSILHDEPAPLPATIGGELEVVLHTALAKDAGRRYQTAGALERDLQHYLRGEPLDAHPATALYRLRKTIRRYQRGVAMAAVLLVVTLGAVVGLTIQWRTTERARAATETTVDFLRLTLFSPFHGGEPGSDHRLLDALLWGSPQVTKRFADDPQTELRLHDDFARVLRQFGQPDAAIHHAQRSHELTVELFGERSREAGDTAHRLARLLFSRLVAHHLGVPWRKTLGKGADAPQQPLSGLSDRDAADLARAFELEATALAIRREHDDEAAETSAASLENIARALGERR